MHSCFCSSYKAYSTLFVFCETENAAFQAFPPQLRDLGGRRRNSPPSLAVARTLGGGKLQEQLRGGAPSGRTARSPPPSRLGLHVGGARAQQTKSTANFWLQSRLREDPSAGVEMARSGGLQCVHSKVAGPAPARPSPFPLVLQDAPERGSGESGVSRAVWPNPRFPSPVAASTLPFEAPQMQGQGLPGSCHPTAHLEDCVPLF